MSTFWIVYWVTVVLYLFISFCVEVSDPCEEMGWFKCVGFIPALNVGVLVFAAVFIGLGAGWTVAVEYTRAAIRKRHRNNNE
jgi:hypothetical protein